MNATESPATTLRATAAGATMGRMFLTVDEAARRLGVKRSWLYERTRHNSIPHRRLGKLVRFTEQDLESIAAAAAVGELR